MTARETALGNEILRGVVGSTSHTLVEACPWEADVDAITRFMVRAHLEHWRSSRAGSEAEKRNIGLVPASR